MYSTWCRERAFDKLSYYLLAIIVTGQKERKVEINGDEDEWMIL
jgi:hypothetical protein